MLLSRPLFAGELWWSGLARHADRLGLCNLVPRHLTLTGNRCSLGSPLFPRQLANLNRRMQLAPAVHELIHGHTALPYYRPFFSPAKISAAMAAITGSGNAEFRLGLAAMEDHPEKLRLCPRCEEHDIANYGEAAWRTVHQLPGSVLCPDHSCALIETDVSARCHGQYLKLVSVRMAARRGPIEIPSEGADDLGWIAATNQALLSQSISQPSPGKLSALYRRLLGKQGYVDRFNRLKLAELTAAFHQRFQHILPLLVCRRPEAEKRDNWLARLVGLPRHEQSPLKHLLVMRFLGLGPLDALEMADAENTPLSRSPSLVRPERRSKRITAEKVASQREQWLALRRDWKGGSLREHADALYSWLWRNDHAWLRAHAR